MGGADFNQFIRLRSQLVVAVRDFSKEENLRPVRSKRLAKDRNRSNLHTKLDKVVENVHR